MGWGFEKISFYSPLSKGGIIKEKKPLIKREFFLMFTSFFIKGRRDGFLFIHPFIK